MIALDMKTVLLGYVLSNIIGVVVIALLWRDNRDRYAGITFWLTERVLQLLAILIVLLRGVLPESVSIMLASPFGVGGAILLYVGLERYAGKQVPQWPNAILFAALVAAQAWFTFVQPNLSTRNIILSFSLMVVCAQCAWLLLCHTDADMRRDARPVGVIFCTYILINTWRIHKELVMPSPDDIFRSSSHGSLTLMLYQMVAISVSFSLFLMVNRRVMREILKEIAERNQLEKELAQQAHHDYLTGVNNRRYFMELAEQELSRAIRYGNPMSVFMIDIDFFKQVNDTHGHKAGDHVLEKLAEVCRKTLREVDVIGRIGGEEFAILLPETDGEVSAEVAERLRAALANAKVPQDSGGLPIQFTVSIGIASLMSKEDNLDVLISLADKALYEAKESGRNKVCVAVQQLDMSFSAGQ